jgi:hypothetical protein
METLGDGGGEEMGQPLPQAAKAAIKARAPDSIPPHNFIGRNPEHRHGFVNPFFGNAPGVPRISVQASR